VLPGLALSLVPMIARADPWSSGVENIKSILTGPAAQGVCVIGIVLAGLGGLFHVMQWSIVWRIIAACGLILGAQNIVTLIQGWSAA
jgi:type IV secretory pathway VirB2 component (pilin)